MARQSTGVSSGAMEHDLQDDGIYVNGGGGSVFMPSLRYKKMLKLGLTPCLVGPQSPKSCYSTCHIECLRPVHGALNVDEKKN